MGKLAVIEFVTLDGVMQGFGGPEEDRDDGFVHGGWGAPYADEVQFRSAAEGIAETTAYLWGRKTYQHMAAHWPNEPDTNPIAKHLNNTPKYVITNTLTRLDWPGSNILTGDPVASVRGLKARTSGTIAVMGSGVLVQTLVDHDLIEEYRLFIYPLVLGTGKRLFRGAPHPLRFQLVKCVPTSTGVLMCSYRSEGSNA